MRVYVNRDPAAGWEIEGGTYYECTICGSVLHSATEVRVECKCQNLYIEPESFRMGAKNETRVLMFRAAARKRLGIASD